MANTLNITGIQGSTLLLSINLRDSNANYINLSGYGVRSYVKSKFSTSDVLLDLNPRINSYVSGQITISGSATGIAAIPCNIYPYDVEIYISGGADTYTLKPLRGYFYCFPEVTY